MKYPTGIVTAPAHFNREALAWAVGFFEGEGSVSGFTSDHRLILASVVQVNRLALERFEIAVGMGKILGPYYKEDRQPSYRWHVSGYDRIQYLACLLWDGLTQKRRSEFRKAFATWTAFRPPYKFQLCLQQRHDTYKDKTNGWVCRDCNREYMREYQPAYRRAQRIRTSR